MFNTKLPLKRSTGVATEDCLRVIVFEIANYLFALPVGAVLKVVTCPPISTPIKNGIGMLELGDSTVTIVDLSQKLLEETDCHKLLPQYRFLILMQTRTGELCGIPVDNPPVMTDIPLTTIRQVPLSVRLAQLTFASHMAILPETEESSGKKIFLLGVK